MLTPPASAGGGNPITLVLNRLDDFGRVIGNPPQGLPANVGIGIESASGTQHDAGTVFDQNAPYSHHGWGGYSALRRSVPARSGQPC